MIANEILEMSEGLGGRNRLCEGHATGKPNLIVRNARASKAMSMAVLDAGERRV